MRSRDSSSVCKLAFACFCLIVMPSCNKSYDKQAEYYVDEEEVDASDSIKESEASIEPETMPQVLSEKETNSSTSDVVIPYTQRGGVKLVNVEINGAIGVNMVIDSGASSTLISLAEAQYLAQKGVLTEDDILGQETAQIADGSITLNTLVRLRQIVIDNQIVCTDVIAMISDNFDASLLLGNEVLNRVGSYTIDNDNCVIVFHNVPNY